MSILQDVVNLVIKTEAACKKQAASVLKYFPDKADQRFTGRCCFLRCRYKSCLQINFSDCPEDCKKQEQPDYFRQVFRFAKNDGSETEDGKSQSPQSDSKTVNRKL